MPDRAGYSIHSMELGPMENFVYLLHDHASNQAAIIDPAWDVKQIIQLAQNKGIQISDILLTHSHHDHVNGIGAVLAEYDAEVHLLKAEAEFWDHSLVKPSLHHGGDVIQIGRSEISVMHTPGHTPGSACYNLDHHLIAGDTLFVFGCGRCDLAGGDPETLFSTLRKIKTQLPGHTVIHPGHNYAPQHPTSTLEKQIEGNPFMHFDREEDFVEYRMHAHDRVRSSPYGEVSAAEALESIGK